MLAGRQAAGKVFFVLDNLTSSLAKRNRKIGTVVLLKHNKYKVQVKDLECVSICQFPGQDTLLMIIQPALGLLLADGAPTVGRGKTF